MKKPVKITLTVLGSLLALVIVALVVVSQFVFDKDRLTPIVKDFAHEYITCQTEVGDVDLAFFSTFPKISLQLNSVAVINPMEGAQSDTLLGVDRLFAEIDVMDYLLNSRVTITGFRLEGAQANLYVGEDSVANYDVFNLGADSTETSTADTTSASASALDRMSLHNISVEGLSATWLDRTTQMEARCRDVNLSLDTDASLQSLSGGGDVALEVGELFYSDTLNYASVTNLQVKQCRLFYDGKNAEVDLPSLSVESQEYLLSGDIALLARLWNTRLEDIDLKWEDGHPTLVGTTSLDSASVTLGSDDMIYVNTEAAYFDMPVTSTPEVWTAQVDAGIDKLTFAMDSEGTLVDRMDLRTQFTASTDSAFTDFTVQDLSAKAGSQKLEGDVHVNMADTSVIKADVDVTLAKTTLSELLALVPAAYRDALKGMDLKARLDDTHVKTACEVRGSALQLGKTEVNSRLRDFGYSDNTGLSASFDDLTLGVSYPAGTKGRQIELSTELSDLQVALTDTASDIQAALPQATLLALVQDDIIDGKDPRLNVKFVAEALNASLDDTISVSAKDLRGSADVDMRAVKGCIKVDTKANLGSLTAAVGKTLDGGTGAVGLDLNVVYDSLQTDVLDMLSPVANFVLDNGNFRVEGLPYNVQMPHVSASFNKNQAMLQDCKLQLGASDLGLKGTVSNISAYLKNQALLTAELDLNSKKIDAGQLMDLVSGFGADSTDLAEGTETTAAAETTATATATTATAGDASQAVVADTVNADPFMVPKDVNVVVNTNVQSVVVGDNTFDNVKGRLTCDDGTLVLEQMGFTSKAADMQLTALYKSPRRNNLFVGWNFHLLNIDISEMIRLVPEIDSIAPMLKSFEGKAEFHLAGETGLFADYSPKMSTLKAVAAIEGKDLKVLDSETFQTIKNYLFKESTTNKIDTLSVELAVARKKMTLYPMLIGWDKYEAIIAGTHTVVGSMPFNYNISITKCPLVGGHLGLDITGNLDDVDNISFKVGGCKYANLYKPEKRNVTQSQTLELKKLINSSLKRTVKTTESEASGDSSTESASAQDDGTVTE